ncbi:MAG: outer membrane lipid asymmetry maintenance protein MlaD [Deltaproteobacteria bacterium]|nr:outer membrane lipid asymmetry maintenance protein MlaD [Deltaproteobacteria bacterium]
MKKTHFDFIVGLFLLVGFGAFAYMTTQYGEFSLFESGKYYDVSAEFNNVTGLKVGANVSMAGVEIGKVSGIRLTEDYMAHVTLYLEKRVKIAEDAIASIKTQGIIGDKFIKISQGGSEDFLKDGDFLFETESTVDLEDLISQFVFGKV